MEKILKTQRKRVLFSAEWYSPAFQLGIARYAKEAGWILDADEHSRRLRSARQTRHCDGLILLPECHAPSWVKRSGIPAVSIGHRDEGLPRVGFDNHAIGRMAAAHFIERGFKDFAFYRDKFGPGENERAEGFKNAILAAGGRLHHLGALRSEAKAQRPRGKAFDSWLGRQLLKLPKPLAISAEFDDLAIEALDACLAAGLRVPEQVAILGVDNDEMRCPFAAVPLSSVDSDLSGAGYAAAKLLDSLMAGGQAPHSPVLIKPKGIAVRQSTDMLAIGRIEVASALRFIWRRRDEGIRAKDVVERSGMSRQRLHQLFLEHLGRSVSAEISRRRIEAASEMLKDSKLKVHEIAKRAGFSGATHLCRSFKKECGVTPGSLRRK